MNYWEEKKIIRAINAVYRQAGGQRHDGRPEERSGSTDRVHGQVSEDWSQPMWEHLIALRMGEVSVT